MKRIRVLLAVSLICGCRGEQPAPSTPVGPTPSVTSVVVSGTTPAIGETTQFTATATFSNSTTQDVTSQATWRSSNTAVVTVSNTGAVTGVGAGETDVSATYQNVSGSQHLSLVMPPRTFTLAGVISDASTGRPIQDAEIEVLDGENAGKKSPGSDGNGYYSLPGLVAGTFTTRARAPGYDPRDQSVNMTNSDVRVDFTLQQSCSFTLAPLRFSASRGGFITGGGKSGFTVDFTITASRPACAWTATSDSVFLCVGGSCGVPWPHSVSGTGSAAVFMGVGVYTGSAQIMHIVSVRWSGGGADVVICQPNC